MSPEFVNVWWMLIIIQQLIMIINMITAFKPFLAMQNTAIIYEKSQQTGVQKCIMCTKTLKLSFYSTNNNIVLKNKVVKKQNNTDNTELKF